MKLILLGPPGSGKGTQARMLAKKFHVPGISTGEILRQAIEENTDLGKKAQVCVEAGNLVDDVTVIGLIKERIKDSDCESGFILDGFPRTIIQAEKLDATLGELNQKIDFVVDLEVDEEDLVTRLSGRGTCRNCGAMFHETTRAPKEPGKCDVCGGELYQRMDDNKETIYKRLEVYRNETAPLKEFYENQGKLQTAKGFGSVEDVFDRICALVN
jgi:adenylate kinase